MPLTRRDFAGVASCTICAVTGFIATDALAQGTPPAATPGVTRKIFLQTDGPAPGYVTITAEAEIEAGVTIARQTDARSQAKINGLVLACLGNSNFATQFHAADGSFWPLANA